jgi:hypothetical protein
MKNVKTKCGQQTGKALSNHESFSPSQSHETVPLGPYQTDATVLFIQGWFPEDSASTKARVYSTA